MGLTNTPQTKMPHRSEEKVVLFFLGPDYFCDEHAFEAVGLLGQFRKVPGGTDHMSLIHRDILPVVIPDKFFKVGVVPDMIRHELSIRALTGSHLHEHSSLRI